MQIRPEIPLIEEILQPRRDVIGEAFGGYRNHVYRVLHFSCCFHQGPEEEEDKLAIAAAFHDLGMWPGDEIDYLAPSIRLAEEWLEETDRSPWKREIATMIEYHHRFRRWSDPEFPLVEVLRKGDWVDASMGWRRFGLPRSTVQEVQAAFENLGFHRNLMRIACREFRHRPLNPLPMMKW